MNYCSTRNSKQTISSAEAILNGISSEGGLVVPKKFPKVSKKDILKIVEMSYAERAKWILSLFFTDFSDEELSYCAEKAYGENVFEEGEPAPLTSLSDGRYMLELWHGPTAAFKDMALSVLPHLMTLSAKKLGCNSEIVILTATSGDTGKAALAGFANVPGVKIFVFYPHKGVSEIQMKQMITQEANNAQVAAVYENFDGAQTAVKELFVSRDLRAKLKENGYIFSSANSINLGRLIPQVVYYFSAYADLLKADEIKLGEKINITVPTGNFGNILAAYYVKRMGLPIGKLICASNINNILTDFINTSVYDRNRPFYRSSSPSMDILVSSNLERLLYHLENDAEKIVALYREFAETGRFSISEKTHKKVADLFFAACCDQEETMSTIKTLFDETGYLCDPHTAVAVSAEKKYRIETEDDTKSLIVSTASPFKFPSIVLSALGEDVLDDEFEALKKLSEVSKVAPPQPILELKNLTERFLDEISISDMENYILKKLGI